MTRIASRIAPVMRECGRRLVEGAVVLGVVSVLSFVLLGAAAGDAATAIVERRDGDATQAAVRTERHELGLDRPVLDRYVNTLDEQVHGNFGTSLRTGLPVGHEVGQRIGPTALLAMAATVLSVVLGVGLGILAALASTGWVAIPLRVIALAVLSLPAFALAYLAVLVFGLQLHWLPTQGMSGTRSLILPASVLGLPLAAALSRVTEARLRAEMAQPYITTARSRGLSPTRSVIFHALPNACAPLLIVFGNYVGYAIAGTLVVETVFGWPGLGAYLVGALQFRDWYPLQAAVLLIALAAIVARGLAGSVAAVIDPRTSRR